MRLFFRKPSSLGLGGVWVFQGLVGFCFGFGLRISRVGLGFCLGSCSRFRRVWFRV